MFQEILYFDDDGIAGLSAQLPDAGLRNYCLQSEDETSSDGALKSKFSLGKILQFIGVPTLDIGAKVSTGKRSKSGRIENYEITPYELHRKLVAALTVREALYRNIDAARLASVAKNGSVFCNIDAKFLPLKDYESTKWISDANSCGYLVLKHEKIPSVTMGMSLSKMPGINSANIGNASHLAVCIRGNSGINLSVFGRFDGKNYIKPYVVTYY